MCTCESRIVFVTIARHAFADFSKIIFINLIIDMRLHKNINEHLFMCNLIFKYVIDVFLE